MLNALAFSVNCVAPYFLLILFGWTIRRLHIIREDFFKASVKYVFRIGIPVQLFLNIITISKDLVVSQGFLATAAIVNISLFVLAWLIVKLVYKNREDILGTLIQGAFRSNYVLLGIPLVGATLGQEALQIATIASLAYIPITNIAAVIALTTGGKSVRKDDISNVLKQIIRNPQIIAMLIALTLLLFNITLPDILFRAVTMVGQTSTPLGLMAVGGVLSWYSAKETIKPAVFASALKVIVLPAILTAVCIAIGYRGAELFALFVLVAAPVAVSSYSMAVEMDGDGPLASNILIITTLSSAFTLAFGVYILRLFAFI